MSHIKYKYYINRINENDYILYAFFLLILPQPFYPDMVSKCDLCNKTFARQRELGRHVRIVHETRDMNVEFVTNYLRENTHLQNRKSCMTRY